MKSDFIDRILLQIQKEKVIKLHNERLTLKQIQEKMNLSEDWIKEVCAEADEQMKIDNTTEPY
jgi:hypothetical protein